MIKSFFALELDRFAITLSSRDERSAIISILPLGAAIHLLTNLACGEPVAGWLRGFKKPDLTPFLSPPPDGLTFIFDMSR